jgi:urease accessory protein
MPPDTRTMTDPAPGAFLAALQLGDPGLPIGRFVHSHGLEAWLDRRADAGEPELEELVRSVILEGVGPLDGAAVALAHRCRSLGELAELDGIVSARKTLAPARVASQTCGRQLALLAPRLTDDGLALELAAAIRGGELDGNLAVVSGTLARALGIDEREAVLLELRGAMTSLLSSALRLGRLGPIGAQTMALRLSPALVAACEAARATPAGELHSSAVELDVAALAHGRRDARTFAT